MFSATVTKGNNFCDFLFYNQDDMVLPKSVLFLKIKNFLVGERIIYFFLKFNLY